MIDSLKICSLNSRGIKGNLHYIEILNSQTDIFFICEHWLHNHEKYLIDSIDHNKTVIFDSSMDNHNTIGRPFGGLCWLTDSKINIVKYEFISNFLSIVNVLIGEKQIFLLGVYCIINNNTSDNTRIYENQLAIISSLIDQYRDENNDFIILGDFNADPYRNRYSFDKLFNDFLIDNDLELIINNNFNYFTYSNENFSSFIDHFLTDKNSNLSFLNSKVDFNIQNTSDHNGIFLTVQIQQKINDENK